MCPPNNHLTNQAEKAIDTWECQFLAGLRGVDPKSPLNLWWGLLPQATETLNILHRSWINPRLSAEDQLNGAFNYKRKPVSPPGKKLLIHETL